MKGILRMQSGCQWYCRTHLDPGNPAQVGDLQGIPVGPYGTGPGLTVPNHGLLAVICR